MTSRPPNNTGGRVLRGTPRPLPRGLLVPVHRTGRARDTNTPNPPTHELPVPPLEELVREKRRACKRAAVRLTVRIVLVEIWLTSFIGTMIAIHSQSPEHAITTATHPWMWWTVPATFPVRFAGTVMIIQTLCILLIGTVLELRRPEYDAAAIRRHFLGC